MIKYYELIVNADCDSCGDTIECECMLFYDDLEGQHGKDVADGMKEHIEAAGWKFKPDGRATCPECIAEFGE